MNDNRKKYELFGQMDPVKFMDFMIDFLDNLGMNRIWCGYYDGKQIISVGDNQEA